MSEVFRCGRRDPWVPGSPFLFDQVEKQDTYRDDNTCSYCGSMNPDFVMQRLRQGDATITPTDKSYKIYLENRGGAPWTVRGANKFYFPHFNEDQMREFIDLLNDKKLHFAYPGHFYVMPYFMRPA